MEKMESRLKNTKKNFVFGLITQFFKIVLSFVSRTIFIYFLGKEYLGLNGLFTSVLSMLSLADLGIGSALGYALYAPIAKNDKKKLQALMRVYKIAYIIIGVVIGIIGSFLIPFLKYLVRFDESISINYYVIYIMFLFDTMSTYLFAAYRSSLLTASQQEYIVNNVTSAFDWITNIVQLLVMLVTKNYYIYLGIKILFNIIKNLYLSNIVSKKFPYIDQKHNEKLLPEDVTSIKKNIYALFLGKISARIHSSIDNIIISAFLGTLLVGYYSNYYTIIYAVTTIIGIVIGSAKASVGNLNVVSNSEHKFLVFKRIRFINLWGYSVASVCLLELLTPTIEMWLGSDFVLDDIVVFIVVLNFLVTGLNHTTMMFKDACGLFWQTRYRALLTAIINLVASVFLVQIWGIAGVFAATILSYCITILPYDSYVLFKYVFKANVKTQYIWYFKVIFISALSYALVHFVCSFIHSNSWGGIIVRAIVSFTVSNLVVLLFSIKSEELKYYLRFFKATAEGIYRRCKKT